MKMSVYQIERMLQPKRCMVRKANAEDILFIKNELFSHLRNKEDEHSKHIRSLLNEMHYLEIVIESEDEQSVVYYYEPNQKYAQNMKLNECGWIQIDK